MEMITFPSQPSKRSARVAEKKEKLNKLMMTAKYHWAIYFCFISKSMVNILTSGLIVFIGPKIPPIKTRFRSKRAT